MLDQFQPVPEPTGAAVGLIALFLGAARRPARPRYARAGLAVAGGPSHGNATPALAGGVRAGLQTGRRWLLKSVRQTIVSGVRRMLRFAAVGWLVLGFAAAAVVTAEPAAMADAPAVESARTPRPTPIATFQSKGNPVFEGADPHAIVQGRTLWIYTTRSFERGRRGFWAIASDDLVNWRVYGPVLEYKGIGWIESLDAKGHGHRMAWAPSAVELNGQFHFYYSVGPQDALPSHIGAAVGKHPWGPFRDIGRPLVVGALREFEAIDPMVFTDPADGRHYLYAGGSNPGVLRVWELDDTLLNIVREVNVEQPPRFTEGAFMHVDNGRYYLTYSSGHWRDASYSVHVAEAESPVGPWQYRGPILVSDARHKGPGHHSIVHSPHTNAPYIVYHRWNNREGNGPYRGDRVVAIEPLEYDAEGHIVPVKMSDSGVSAREWLGRSRPSARPKAPGPSANDAAGAGTPRTVR